MLLLEWQNGKNEYPEFNDWIEVTGTFGHIEKDGIQLKGIHLSSITTLETRGVEFILSYHPN